MSYQSPFVVAGSTQQLSTKKPEIITQEYGKHNTAFEDSRSRILEGGSWKLQRTVVLIPSAYTIPAKVALAHWNLIFPPNQNVYRYLCLGMEVGDAYSSAIDEVLKHPELSNWEYILTIEHDNIPPPDGLLRLLRRMEEHPEYSVIGGLYWTKGEMGVPQIWGDPKDPILNFRPQPPIAGELVECCGTGMGFTLWRLDMFKNPNIARPFFKTYTGENGQGISTQDLSAWIEFKKYGYRCAIDCGTLVGHYDYNSDTVW